MTQHEVFPFRPDYRASGVLLHVTSLPTPYGIGDMGPTACAWIDMLVEAGQSWWQILPLVLTAEGYSPYFSLSSFAGNLLLVSPQRLVEDGLLAPSDLATWTFAEGPVDYERVTAFKYDLLERVWTRYRSQRRLAAGQEFDAFCQEQAYWLDDFVLFMGLKQKYHETDYFAWPAEVLRREPVALAGARGELGERLDKLRFWQYLFFRQWRQVKDYAAARGLRILGDLPIFVSPGAVEVWMNPEYFLVDDQLRPTVIAGVPPDYFSPTGQLWGNPLYNWDALRRDGYAWWLRRIEFLRRQLDLIRLDHFRGFESAWHVAADAETAEHGHWVPGPGGDFFARVRETFGVVPFVAEDLGLITTEVRQLRDAFHLPGMRVLQFAFDGFTDNPFLPHHYQFNTVVYTGTHDNDTTRHWYQTIPDWQRHLLWDYLGRPWGEAADVAWELIRLAHTSVAAVSIIPAQDLLNLDGEARMNRPGQRDDNWQWRLTSDMPWREVLARFRTLTEQTGRLPVIK